MKKTAVIKLDHEAAYSDLSALVCPTCSGDDTYLHHGDVVVYDRGEDSAVVRETRVGVAVVVRSTDGAHNPSGRRDGLAIEFTCEHCHGTDWDGSGEFVNENPRRPHRLTIAQHKGMTYLQWEIS